MSTPSDTSHARVQDAVRLDGSVSRSVAEDLEAIFPNAPAAGPAESRLRLRGLKGARTTQPLERRTAAWGAVIAAACIGVSAGALISRGGSTASSAPEPAAAAKPAVVLAAAAPAPLPTPAAPALPNPGPLAPAPLQRASLPQAPVSEPAARVAPAKPRKAAVRTSVARRKPVSKAASLCGGSRCDHSDVMAADRRLRRAYSAAVRAGVSRSVLVDYRNRWAGLRHRAPRQPGLVVSRYSSMAGDLNRMAGRHRVADQRQGSSWRSAALY